MGYPSLGRDLGSVEVLWDGGGVPPSQREQTENITFPHPSDAGGINEERIVCDNLCDNYQSKEEFSRCQMI